MKKTNSSKMPRKKRNPGPKWQTGDYEPRARFSFIFPDPFLMLCRLCDVAPETVLTDFVDNLSHRSWKREGRDEAKVHLVDYFVAHGYGRLHYTEQEIRQLFREMDALGSLFPKNGPAGLLDRHVKWRHSHEKHWFKTWFRKPRRQL